MLLRLSSTLQEDGEKKRVMSEERLQSEETNIFWEIVSVQYSLKLAYNEKLFLFWRGKKFVDSYALIPMIK